MRTAILVLLAAGAVAADEPAGGTAESRRSAWLHKVYLADAEAYRFSIDGPKPRPLKLQSEPVMRWTSGGDYQGEVYVWVDEGRAAVVGCFFSGPQGGPEARRVLHEFHSLTQEPLKNTGTGNAGWQSQQPGITPQPIAGAPAPAATRTLRLAQMRALAREFKPEVDRSGKWELRLLPQPLSRYEDGPEGSAVIDGAVFAYIWAAGTDPELLIVIEAVKTDGQLRWQFAPARFTNRDVWVNHRNREIWRGGVPTAGIADGVKTLPYGVFIVKSVNVPPEAR